MILSVVSGKGGAGKTTVATSLAFILKADYYDMDVDAPNGEYFLQPKKWQTRQVYQSQPVIDADLCTGCGLCTQKCRFHALYKIINTIYLTETLCHSCNLCREVCPGKAISYRQVPIGEVRTGYAERTEARAIIGDLLIGSTRGTSLIKDIVRNLGEKTGHVILDGPPGNSCAAVAAIKPSDFVVLVVEPTPFGIHDMLQSIELIEKMGKPIILIANKSQGDDALQAALAPHNIKIAASIPLTEESHSQLLDGQILAQASPKIYDTLRAAISTVVPL